MFYTVLFIDVLIFILSNSLREFPSLRTLFSFYCCIFFETAFLTNERWDFIVLLICLPLRIRTSLVAQMVKHPLTMRETQVQSLGWEDPLEKEVATHSSTLAWKIPWTEEPSRLRTVHRVTKSQTRLSNFNFTLKN